MLNSGKAELVVLDTQVTVTNDFEIGEPRASLEARFQDPGLERQIIMFRL